MGRPDSNDSPKDCTADFGFVADFGSEHADTFRRDLHSDLRTSHLSFAA